MSEEDYKKNNHKSLEITIEENERIVGYKSHRVGAIKAIHYDFRFIIGCMKKVKLCWHLEIDLKV